MQFTERNSSDFRTLSQIVYEKIRDGIIEGRLGPGAKLVRRTLAKEMAVSPIPVTEALWRLEQDGLVESVPMYGSRVKALTSEVVANELVMRAAIECQAARICARDAQQRDFDSLMEKAIPLDRILMSHDRNSKKGVSMHLDFHLSIAHLSGFPILVKALERAGFMELKWTGLFGQF